MGEVSLQRTKNWDQEGEPYGRGFGELSGGGIGGPGGGGGGGGWWGGGGATHSLGVGTNCETKAPTFRQWTAPEFSEFAVPYHM